MIPDLQRLNWGAGFAARREALGSRSALLRAQRDKVQQEREALRAQIVQAAESLRHQRAELETHRNLQKEGFISATRISQLEAHIRTEDVSRVQRGQAAEIRFTAFKYRTTRLVEGKLLYVSPDRLVDRVSNQPYYVAMVEADPASLAQAEDVKLLAGMLAEVYIKGETRTPLKYLLEPVTQVLRRAGRER